MTEYGDENGNAEHAAEIAQHVESAGRLADFARCDRTQDRVLGGGHRHRHTGAGKDQVFVTRAQLRRVSQVAVPTFLFCVATQWLGIYVASFILVAGFMGIIGRIAWWKSLLTAAVFSILMFGTFDVAFDVLMPKGPLETWFGY